MNLLQIEYFLEIAQCKNISTAAKHLYITQPTLSRQISNIEKELNMQLFIRSNKGLKLSPAGSVLYEELSQMMRMYKQSLKKAFFANMGSMGVLSIGVVEGLDVSFLLQDMIEYFQQNYPSINVVLKRLSFKALVDGLHHGKLDAAISFDFNFLGQNELVVTNLKRFQPAFAVPMKNLLSQKERLDFKDFENEPLVIVEEEECSCGVSQLVERFQMEGGFYPNFYFVDSMADAILRVESGSKCALFNMDMTIANSKSVKMFPVEDNKKNYIQVAKKSDNTNFALNLMMSYFADIVHSE